MKYLFFIAFAMFAICCNTQNPEKNAAQSDKVEDVATKNSYINPLNQKIDEIQSPVRDIEARHYALQVQQNVSTLEDLEKSSKSWLGTEKANKELLELVRTYVRKGTPIVITDEERTKLEENRKQVRALLNVDSEKTRENKKEEQPVRTFDEKMAKINEIQMSVIDLKSRSIASSIIDGKETMEQFEEYSKSWIGTKEYKAQLLGKVRNLVKKGKVDPLSEREIDKLNNSTLEIRDILQ